MGRLRDHATNLGLKAVGAIATPQGREFMATMAKQQVETAKQKGAEFGENVKNQAEALKDRVERGADRAMTRAGERIEAAKNTIEAKANQAVDWLGAKSDEILGRIQDAALRRLLETTIRNIQKDEQAIAARKESLAYNHSVLQQLRAQLNIEVAGAE